MMAQDELKRYSRQMILPEIGLEGQQKLKEATVLVIGAGGLGCPILQYLTGAGVGTIGIVDDDVVDMSNLQRQVLFSTADVGKSKAETAAAKLSLLNPHVQFKAYRNRLTTSNAEEILASYNLIVDGSDNFPTRYLVNDTCVALGKPLVYGSIQKFFGQVSVFNYKGGPTYRCLFPEPPAEGEVPNCGEAGVLGVLPGIVGSYMASEAIKVICAIGEPLSGKLLVLDVLHNDHRLLQVKRSVHADQVPTTERQQLKPACKSVAGVAELSRAELDSYLQRQQVHLVDVREPHESDEFNIGGENIPLAELPVKWAQMPQDKTIVFYCQSGARSRMAAMLLKQLDAPQKVFSLKGGIQG